ncbi:hypothetical protein NEAUS04_2538 [Nematocida ausubeli]|uniref:Uncharacterized protein n=2 Tax=Nematocida ausubeli (strain ATCC PRA-371 / ERTm2) TaxID=1913371 RepID=A0A086J0A8_NEMA1|nr:uncharacterized protein NESG_02356 [Nematocida ausubeli]KAI5150796.1 hypothetical protein NEAUS05_2302 [Nematocida ausubeli]KAI5165968.1 hypothetical protein NEAUS04_2538 [Nematocida ausubeli]KFG25576.1 hypothetical protein NESG_02356 [Nematocida ausubeli]
MFPKEEKSVNQAAAVCNREELILETADVHDYTLPAIFEKPQGEVFQGNVYMKVKLDPITAVALADKIFSADNDLLFTKRIDALPFILNTVTRSLDIEMDSSISPHNQEVFKTITRRIIEANIVNYLKTLDLPILQTKDSARNQRDFIITLINTLCNDGLQNAIQLAQNNINSWYTYILLHSELKTDSYLLYAFRVINENTFTNPCTHDALIESLFYFLAYLDENGCKVQDLDLFEKRPDGVYNIDYAIDILIRLRVILDQYTEKNNIRSFLLTDYEKQLLFELSRSDSLVLCVLNAIREITKDAEKYIDYEALVAQNNSSSISLAFIKNPTGFKYREKTIDSRMNAFFKTCHDLPESAKEYIKARINLFKKMVAKPVALPKRNMSIVRKGISFFGVLTSVFTAYNLFRSSSTESIL